MSDETSLKDLLQLCGSVVQKVTGKRTLLSEKHRKALQTVVSSVEAVREKGKEAVALYEALEPDLKKIKAEIDKRSTPGKKRSLGDKK